MTRDEQEQLDAVLQTSREMLEVAYLGLMGVKGADYALNTFVSESIKAALANGADHVDLAQEVIFGLIDLIKKSEHMNYPTVGEDIARDIAHALAEPELPSNVVRLH